MDIKTVIDTAQGGAAIDNLASAFGVPRDKAEAVANAMMTALSERIERNTLSRGGVADILELLGDKSAGRALGDAKLAAPDIKQSGDHVLDVLIGNKHISRGIAQRAGRQSGVDPATVEKMLPVVASLLVGGLQKQAAPLFAQRFGAIPGIGDLLPMPDEAPPRPTNGTGGHVDEPQSPRPAHSPRQPIPRSAPVGGSGGDILPMPKGPPPRNGYDDLSDVVRKGRTPAPGGGGSLSDLIRSILAGLLGFKNRGVIGSLVYMLLARFAMNLLRRFLGRMTGGR